MTGPSPSKPAASAPPPPPPSDGGEKEGSKYRGTLNLPKTSFPMKANLVQNEPASQKRWQAMNLYQRTREMRKGSPKFVFHDGPPYANADIHVGHLLNKCLKDFVVRSRTMMGMDCPFVPGWDCHGLPIEHKVMTDLVETGKFEKLKTLTEDQRRMAVRRECQKHAEKFVKVHTGQMQRLLTLAEYERPYLTMTPEFEGATLEVLASLVEQGLVYRALKPVHWSIANETALAEAELEYEDRVDTSVYVDFEAADAAAVYDAFGLEREIDAATEPQNDEGAAEGDGEDAEAAGEEGPRPHSRPSFMIWTTTPWTLPANLAIAVNPKFVYALVKVDGNVTVMAADAVERVTKAAKSEDVKVLATTTGDRLVGLRYIHPFADPREHLREQEGRKQGSASATRVPDPVYTVVGAEYVTLEDGTGLVHTAPGHGAEDYATGLRVGLPIYCPVKADGRYDDTVPAWLRGVLVWDANKTVTEHLRASGHLFYDHTFTHSYPHDWRSKTPTIFRSTEQWFVGVDKPTQRDGKSLRQLALDGADRGIKFVPEWGRNRMRGMLESRPDWCISRQRAWGLPIPAFFTKNESTGEEFAVMTPAMIRAVARVVREKGSDCWFTATPEDLLKYYEPGQDTDPSVKKLFLPEARQAGRINAELRKGPDILDVWFESGSTWNGCMRERSGGADFPMDLYLEGSDQHRGWFQTSLLCALGMTGRPPYKSVLTHGFVVDRDGRKMSKSEGNDIKVEEVFKEYGADVARWWVASVPYENDVRMDMSFLALAGESYRKVRNTLRFMLSNLDDFDGAAAAGDTGGKTGATTIDAWVLAEFARVSSDVKAAYERFDYQAVHKAIFDFCNDTLSAVYLAAVKDRLYCDRAGSARRRRTQAALYALTDGLTRLLAPVLCHTADEAFRALRKTQAGDVSACVHLETFAESPAAGADAGWAKIMALRGAALVAIEKAKAGPEAGGIGLDNPLDCGVTLPDPDGTLSRFDPVDLADLLGVSRVTFDRAAKDGAPRIVDLRSEPRCERCWKRDGTVRKRGDGGMLSDRDAEAVGTA